jgi:quercetin dioxygenase-like cupin family protein
MLNVKVLGALVACALIIAVPSLAHGGPIVGKPLAKGTMQATTIDAQAGSMIFEKITVAPRGSFGWHTHSAPVAVAVAAGTLTVFDPTVNGCAPFKVGKGASFVEPANHVHLARNDGKKPVTVYVVYLGVPAHTGTDAAATKPAGCNA